MPSFKNLFIGFFITFVIITLIFIILYFTVFKNITEDTGGAVPVYFVITNYEKLEGVISTGYGYEPRLFLTYYDGDTMKFQTDPNMATIFTRVPFDSNIDDYRYLLKFEGNKYTRILKMEEKTFHYKHPTLGNIEFGKQFVLGSEQYEGIDSEWKESNKIWIFPPYSEILYTFVDEISVYLYAYSNKNCYIVKPKNLLSGF